MRPLMLNWHHQQNAIATSSFTWWVKLERSNRLPLSSWHLYQAVRTQSGSSCRNIWRRISTAALACTPYRESRSQRRISVFCSPGDFICGKYAVHKWQCHVFPRLCWPIPATRCRKTGFVPILFVALCIMCYESLRIAVRSDLELAWNGGCWHWIPLVPSIMGHLIGRFWLVC